MDRIETYLNHLVASQDHIGGHCGYRHMPQRRKAIPQVLLDCCQRLGLSFTFEGSSPIEEGYSHALIEQGDKHRRRPPKTIYGR